jgi:hypothetical protein
MLMMGLLVIKFYPKKEGLHKTHFVLRYRGRWISFHHPPSKRIPKIQTGKKLSRIRKII